MQKSPWAEHPLPMVLEVPGLDPVKDVDIRPLPRARAWARYLAQSYVA